MAKRLGAERKIEENGFKIKVGTLNKLNPKTIYIETGVFISPYEDKEEYKTDTDFLEKSINDNIKNFIIHNKIYDKNYICAFELPSERMKIGKSSYLSLQCHLRQSGNLETNEILEETLKLSGKLFKDIQKSIICSGFTLKKTAKKTIYKENILA